PDGFSFELTYDGQVVSVVVEDGTFDDAEALRAGVQDAIDQAFDDAGLGDVGIDVTLDHPDSPDAAVRIAFNATHTLGGSAAAEAAIALARDGFDLPD